MEIHQGCFSHDWCSLYFHDSSCRYSCILQFISFFIFHFIFMVCIPNIPTSLFWLLIPSIFLSLLLSPGPHFCLPQHLRISDPIFLILSVFDNNQVLSSIQSTLFYIFFFYPISLWPQSLAASLFESIPLSLWFPVHGTILSTHYMRKLRFFCKKNKLITRTSKSKIHYSIHSQLNTFIYTLL